MQASRLPALSHQSGGSDERLAKVTFDQARAALALAQSHLDYTRIVAPVAGTVLARAVKPGHTAQPGKILMSLSPSGETELLVQIDEKKLGLLRFGQNALASADAYPDRHFTAEIPVLSPADNPLRGSVEIRLRVVDPPDYLRQEMTVAIDIETARWADFLTVAAGDIFEPGGEQPWVLVVRDGSARRQAVKLGLRRTGRIVADR